MAMAQTNREAGGIETVFIPAASWLAGFTSTKLRQEISERGEA
jgi:phosphopantetheine adenylyltransferase